MTSISEEQKEDAVSSFLQKTKSSGGQVIKWDQVFIHEFPLILGDNPGVSRGAPLTIDWQPVGHDVVDVDMYEYFREPERKHRKRLVINAQRRAKILLSAGFTLDDIAEATLDAEEAKRMRAENAGDAETSSGVKLKNLGNVMELLSGAAESFGGTMLGATTSAGLGVVKGTGRVGMDIVKGTGRVMVTSVKGTSKVIVGSGRLASDVMVGTVKGTSKMVVGTSKAASGVVVGTVKGTSKVVVGTSKLGYGAVVGTGRVVVGTGRATGNVLKSTGRKMQRMISYSDDDDSDVEADDREDNAVVTSGPTDNNPTEATSALVIDSTKSRRRFNRRGSNESNKSNGSQSNRRAFNRRGSNDSYGSTGSGGVNCRTFNRRGSNDSYESNKSGTSANAALMNNQDKKDKIRRKSLAGSALNQSISGFSSFFKGSNSASKRRSSMDHNNNNNRASEVSPKTSSSSRKSKSNNSKQQQQQQQQQVSSSPTHPASELVQTDEFLEYLQEQQRDDRVDMHQQIVNQHHLIDTTANTYYSTDEEDDEDSSSDDNNNNNNGPQNDVAVVYEDYDGIPPSHNWGVVIPSPSHQSVMTLFE